MAGQPTPRKRHRKTPGETSVPVRPQPHGGALRSGNPGNKGGGRHKADQEAYMRERAALLCADPAVWDVLHARAKSGDIKPVAFSADQAFGKVVEHHNISGELTFRIVKEG